ncbi:MAG TPA: DUF6157 family protein [Sphingobacterium sp.]|nr:DUF6157 family protein [Sphingobacterium sp.]
MGAKTKNHSTNYVDTFIEVAEDTKAITGNKPPSKGDKKTVANIQYDLISQNPYTFTSDEVIFQVHADRNDVTEAEYEEARAQFLSKGQPCLRTSPLTKTYGFGIHCDSNGKIALYGKETEEYQKFLANDNIRKIKAMRSTKK